MGKASGSTNVHVCLAMLSAFQSRITCCSCTVLSWTVVSPAWPIPALEINNWNRRSGMVKVTHLLLIASTFLAFAEGVASRCAPPKGLEKVKRLHGEREANRVNCYVKSATVNCGPGWPPYSLPVPEGNSSPDGIFPEAVTHKRLAPTKNKVHRLRLINLLL